MMKMPELAGTVTVGDRGQIVIPAEARAKLKIKSGDKLLVFSNPHGKMLMVSKAEAFEKHLEMMSEKLDNTREKLKKQKKIVKSTFLAVGS